MIKGSIKRRWNLFLVNHIFVGTRCFKVKRKLLNAIGYEIGERTKIVGPIYNTGKLIVGKDCWIGKNLVVNGNGVVVIGDRCDIAPEVTFLTGGHEIGSAERRAGKGEKYKITVGNGTWIGARATLGKNITIAEGCVIGACACVLASVEENSLVGGVPAKKIQHLPDDPEHVMCEKPLVSVIVPVYNAENYLRKCVGSILAQTYGEIEIILVDDGATDRSGEICDQLADKDERIKVFHKSNGGASSARNFGLSKLNGSYVCFVDSDDTLPNTAIESLLEALKRNSADFVTGELAYDNVTKRFEKTEEVINIKGELQRFLQIMTRNNMYSSCAKIYCTEIIQAQGLAFHDNLRCAEDTVFVREYLQFCKVMVRIPQVVYHVDRSNIHSISKSGVEEYCEAYIEKMNVLKRICNRFNVRSELSEQFLRYRAIHGLRISCFHYLNYWDNPSEKKRLIKKSTELLTPWIGTEQENGMLDTSLRKWWENKKQYIYQHDFESFFRVVEREYKRDSAFRAIKKRVKRMLRCWEKQKGTN